MKLKQFRMEGYRSIGEGGLDVEHFNILIGRNNTGKSNIINALTDYAGYLTYNIDDRVFDSYVLDYSDDAQVVFEEPNWDKILTRNHDYNHILLSFDFLLSEDERGIIISALREAGVGEQYIRENIDSEIFSRISHQLRYEDGAGPNSRWSTTIPEEGWTTVYDSTDSQFQLRIEDLPPTDSNGSTDGTWFVSILRDMISKLVTKWTLSSAFRVPEVRMSSKKADSLKVTGENLVQVLDTMGDNYPSQFERVENTYVEIMEGVTGIRTPYVDEASSRSIVIDENGFSDGFSLDEISAGSKEILTLITQIVKAEDDADLLLIEEPELHLHPGAQQEIYDLLKDVSSKDGPQVIVSTHSDVFVNRTNVSNIISVRRDVETTIETVTEEGVEKILNSLGYEKSEVLQSNAVVFVEGVSDKLVLEEFSKILADSREGYESFDALGITLHPLGGDDMKRHGEELHDTLNHLRIPHLFIIDSDDKPPENKKSKLKKELGGANIFVLNEYCIESYLLKNPSAIAEPFNLKLQLIKDFIHENEKRPNKKSVMNDLFKNVAKKDGGYDEREHAWTIARNVDGDDIPSEISDLIKKIESLAE